QPLDLEQCEPFEKSGEQKTGCEKVWLVSRHEAAAEWLEQACKVTPEKVIQHLDDAELEALKKEKDVCVIGNLPMHRIKAVQEAGAQYVNLDLTVPPEWRGRELTLEEFEQCQPKLRRYQVLDLGEPQLPEEKAS
uniref:CRISPR-associated protein Csx16 n=1 Tax=Sulfurivirga sp. TaxID=2614236 RepID=UPI0025F10ACF